MKRVKFVSVIAAVSFALAPMAASAAATTGTQAAPGTKAAAEKKICKQLPSSMSRLPQRSCLTAKQWKQLQDEAQ